MDDFINWLKSEGINLTSTQIATVRKNIAEFSRWKLAINVLELLHSDGIAYYGCNTVGEVPKVGIVSPGGTLAMVIPTDGSAYTYKSNAFIQTYSTAIGTNKYFNYIDYDWTYNTAPSDKITVVNGGFNGSFPNDYRRGVYIGAVSHTLDGKNGSNWSTEVFMVVVI